MIRRLSLAAWGGLGFALAQLGVFDAPLDHPAIRYEAAAESNPVAALNRKLATGEVRLARTATHGFLRDVLRALDVPVESQTLVYSKTSLQSQFIGPGSPRALYFNDTVAVGWAPDAPLLELTAFDAERGVVFYTLEQGQPDAPRFVRTTACLRCHDTELNVPGLLAGSSRTAVDGAPQFHLGVYATDHQSPFAERWGGKYVTDQLDAPHMGRTAPAERFSRYLTGRSEVAALLAFDHQMHLTNLLVRAGWESRVALARGDAARTIAALAAEVADYLLYAGEAPLPKPIAESSRFAAAFAARGPFDPQGRSLRQLDLKRRFARYRCSYMIYSEAFAALPEQMRTAVYARLSTILAGKETGGRYADFTPEDRRAVTAILKSTIPGLPARFGQ